MMIKDKELTKKIILSASNGHCHTEYGDHDTGYEIWKVNDRLILFEIPLYGGSPKFDCTYDIKNIDYALKRVEEWT